MTVHVPDSKLAGEARRILEALGVDARRLKGADLVVHSPIDGRPLATLDEATVADAKAAIGRAHAAFLKWRSVPAPRRGELVRLLGEELRAAKAELGRLVTIEVGKVESEGLGEVQEMIDICDFAVGLSRQLYGLTIQSRAPRPQACRSVAAGRRRRRHFGVQFPGRGVVVERGAGVRLRRFDRVEAVGEGAADARWRSRPCSAARRPSSAPTRPTGC